MKPRRARGLLTRRPRVIDVVLVVVATVMLLATVSEVRRIYVLRARAPQDRTAFRAFVRGEGRPVATFAAPELVRGVGGTDLECATRRPVLGSGWRLCLFLRRAGPLADRVIGGFRRDARTGLAPPERVDCFGRAMRAGLCVPPAGPPQQTARTPTTIDAAVGFTTRYAGLRADARSRVAEHYSAVFSRRRSALSAGSRTPRGGPR
jgi:hypothetical protein